MGLGLVDDRGNLPVRGGVPGQGHCGQVAGLPADQGDLCQGQGFQPGQGGLLPDQGVADFLQAADLPLHSGNFFREQAPQLPGGTVGQKGFDLRDGDLQSPQHQDGFQPGALAVAVISVAVLPHKGGGEQSHLVVPHQCFFVDAVDGGKLSDGECCLLWYQCKNSS